MKKFLAGALIITSMLGVNVCSADDTFQTVYNENSFSSDMKDNDLRSETFTTPYGEMKFQMRKLWNSKTDNKMHVLVYLKDKKIYENYLPQVDYGYTFKAIKNSADNRQFFVLQSIERALLMGYSPENDKMEIYVDSMNYYHNFEAYPYIGTLKNGDLVLAFEQINIGKNIPARQRYRFIWNKKSNWFAYVDLGFVNNSVAVDME